MKVFVDIRPIRREKHIFLRILKRSSSVYDSVIKTVFAVRNQMKSGMCLPCQELFKAEVKNLKSVTSVNSGFLNINHKTN